jgi:threonine dehydratase
MTPTLTLTQIDRLRARLEPWIRHTPTVSVPGLFEADGPASVAAKFEHWQVTGTFKARGALANVLRLSDEERARGITAVSAGNHAIATAFAAQTLGVDAKVVMIRRANALRVERCRAYGAEVVFADDVHDAFRRVEQIRSDEGRTFIHPFEGEQTMLGTAGVGREFALDAGPLDAVVVPIGGGGLCAGVATAFKLTQPGCAVYGVEPFGADSMRRSFDAGAPVALDRVETIADSLGAPMALPLSFTACREYVDDIVRVSDDELRDAMRRLQARLGFAVEPACAASTAAVAGPLSARLQGRRVGILFCGSNMDLATYAGLVSTEGGDGPR